MTGGASSVLWTETNTAVATSGQCDGSFEANGVSIDSRTGRAGDLFVALKGPNFDGHDFVADAFANGAVAAIVDHDPPDVGAGAPLVRVRDTMEALNGLGRMARSRSQARVIAVTGSVGKTGTKEALKLALGEQGPTSANEGSLNNHWGLPLSLARMDMESRFGVFEMGMNHPGEIEPLSRMARPHVALITTVVAVHSAFFPSIEAIADAKAEIFAGMDADGIAVLNLDNPYFDRLSAAARAQCVQTVIAFGVREEADARLIDLVLAPDHSDVVAEVAGESVRYRLGVPGRHWAMNSLAVLAAVFAVNGDIAAAAAALGRLTAPRGRGRRLEVRINGDAFEVIDESYNASPASMGAAIEVLGQARPDKGGRRIAVLGDMLELGGQADALHAALFESLEAAGIDLVFTAGRHMSQLWDRLPASRRGGHAASAEKLTALVTAAVEPGDVVMVKGSAGSRTGQIVRALLALDGDDDEDELKRMVNGK